MVDLLDYILEKEDIFKPVTKEEIPIRHKQYLKSVFDEVKITKNSDGTVDIEGNLYLDDIGLTSLLELPYRIRKVIGSFSCIGNELTTLEGAPEFVGGCFDCAYNELTTLEGAPEQVGGDFYCYSNKLSEDVEIPSEVKGKVYR